MSTITAQDLAALPQHELPFILDTLYGTAGRATADLLALTADAETLAADAAAGMPDQSGILAQTEALLARATTVATEIARTVGDFTGPLPAGLAGMVTGLAHRVSMAAGTIRDAAPLDTTLRAAYLAAYTLLHQAAQPIHQAAA